MRQGFDKYGVWRVDALPTPNLREAVHLKVGLAATAQGHWPHGVLWAQSQVMHGALGSLHEAMQQGHLHIVAHHHYGCMRSCRAVA
jgi:hypothetical protein